MTHRDDTFYVLHIIDAIEQIEEYLTGKDLQQFCETKLVQDGVIRQLEIIGEATKNLSIQTRNKAPSIPWKSLSGMRDKLIHQYFGVDVDAVWSTVTQDLPMLKKEIKALIKKSLQ